VDAVGRDQDVAARAASVLEAGDDLASRVLDRDEPAIVGNPQAVPRGFVEQDLVEGGAGDGDAGAGAAEIESGDRPPVVIVESELARWRAGRGHAIGKAERGHDAHAVGRDLKTAADGGGLGIGLEDLRHDPAPLEEERQRRSRDAAADDDGAMFLCHGPHDRPATIICTTHDS
jgi:hypothetical protein